MTAPAILLRDLRFQWSLHQQPCIDIPEFSVARGERIFLHGPSGAGKSTLLSLLGGVTLPQNGSIQLLGTELTTLSDTQRNRFRANHIGYIFQQFNLLPWLSVWDNVLLAASFSDQRQQRAGHLADEVQRLLQRLDLAPSDWQRPAGQLSVGQQQRCAAARALLGRPEILIADEPTSSLDPQRQTSFIELLLSEANAVNASLIFVSHDAQLAAHFDRTVAWHDLNSTLSLGERS